MKFEKSSRNSIFQQIVSLIPRECINKVTLKYDANKHRKKYTFFEQFISLLFAQLGDCRSLRQLESGTIAAGGRLVQTEFNSIKRSAFSHLHRTTPYQIYESLYYELFNYFKKEISSSAKVGNELRRILAVDSTTIPLVLSRFDWAHFRTSKGGVKLHTIYDIEAALPEFVSITEAKRSDISVMKEIVDRIAPGSLITMDRGYFDSKLFKMFGERNITFVTRLKKNTLYKYRGEIRNKANYCDAQIQLTGKAAQATLEGTPYRLVYWVDDSVDEKADEEERVYKFLTNADESLSAEEIAHIYRQRWQIELFFKHIKQNCKIKTFIGTSHNAVLAQIWTALIVSMLMNVLHRRALKLAEQNKKTSKSKFFYLIRLRLLMYVDLKWLLKNLEATEEEFINLMARDRKRQLHLDFG